MNDCKRCADTPSPFCEPCLRVIQHDCERGIEHRADIPGYEGRYWASNLGRVGSHDRQVTQLDRWGHQTMRRLKGRVLKPGRIKKPHKPDEFYLFVMLGAGQSPSLVHRLVLLAFVGPCPPGKEACHHDDVPDNNRLDNLRWGTRPENKHDEIRNGRNWQANKTHCKHNHEFTPENTIVRPNGGRGCRRCQADAQRRFQEKATHAHL